MHPNPWRVPYPSTVSDSRSGQKTLPASRQLNQQEGRIQALRAEVTDLKRKRDAAQAKLESTIEGLSMETDL